MSSILPKRQLSIPRRGVSNAKGETTQNYYDDAVHPGNLNGVETSLGDGRINKTTFAYARSAYYAISTTVT